VRRARAGDLIGGDAQHRLDRGAWSAARPARAWAALPAGQRPVKGSLENGWPAHIQQRVLAGWNAYGFPV
jgi:hypothetical protein